ncbi:hypothetical protein F183_A03470 [Bryobacterales bacterium F-183]|nr:hypothetical protein F183_A03470 [Bryobacterales bacterium F-183]
MLTSACLLLSVASFSAQSYSASTVAGTTAIRDGIAATEAYLRQPQGVAVDRQGNIYISDTSDSRIRKIAAADGKISTVAGTGRAGFTGNSGVATELRLNRPTGLVIDPTGKILYFVDRSNYRVRRVDLETGQMTTIAGNGTSRASGDGEAATRAGMSPYSLALEPSNPDVLYVVEAANNRIRKITLSTGIITGFAGNGTAGFSSDNGPALNAQLSFPLAIASDGKVAYIADWGNSLLRKVDLATNVITTAAGDPDLPVDFGDNGPLADAFFYGPDDVSMDAAGNLLILDGGKLRLVAAGGNIITGIAGVSNQSGFAGDGGALNAARFAVPARAIIAGTGDYIIADTGNGRVRRIRSSQLSTIAGSGAVDGKVATETVFNLPVGVARDATGNLFLSDSYHYRVRKIDAATGRVSTAAGTGIPGVTGGRIALPGGMAASPAGIYFADTDSHRVMRINPDGSLRQIAGATNGASGFSGDGLAATSARLRSPQGVAVDSAGNVYIADWGNNRVRRINPEGIITTIVGNGQTAASGDGGPALSAGVSPFGVAVDSAGNLYIADDANSRIRKWTAGTGILTTIAGDGTPGFTGDGGPAAQARLALPTGISVDAQNNVFFSDTLNLAVRRIDGRTGIITSIAGSGEPFFNVESGPALGINMAPGELTVEPSGTILVSDFLNDRIRRLTPLVPRNLLMSSGDGATGFPGGQLAIAVRVTDAAGLPVAGALVNFTRVSGSATLSRASVQTGLDGTATIQLTMGEVLGEVRIRAEVAGLTPVTFTLTNAPENTTLPSPVILSLQGAPGSNPASKIMAPGGLMIITGEKLSPNTALRTVGVPDLVNGKLPTVFNGACVELTGMRAPLLAVSATQIIFQVPMGDHMHGVQVLSGCETPRQVYSEPAVVEMMSYAPEFFYSRAAAAGATSRPISITSSTTFAPVRSVKPGDDIIVYLTGLGATEPMQETGKPVTENALLPIGSVSLKVGTLDIPADQVLYAGTTAELPGEALTPGIPQNVGIYQVRFIVPQDTPDGDQPIRLTIGGITSPEGASHLVVRKEGAAETLLRRGSQTEENDRSQAAAKKSLRRN